MKRSFSPRKNQLSQVDGWRVKVGDSSSVEGLKSASITPLSLLGLPWITSSISLQSFSSSSHPQRQHSTSHHKLLAFYIHSCIWHSSPPDHSHWVSIHTIVQQLEPASIHTFLLSFMAANSHAFQFKVPTSKVSILKSALLPFSSPSTNRSAVSTCFRLFLCRYTCTLANKTACQRFGSMSRDTHLAAPEEQWVAWHSASVRSTAFTETHRHLGDYILSTNTWESLHTNRAQTLNREF